MELKRQLMNHKPQPLMLLIAPYGIETIVCYKDTQLVANY